MTQNGKHRDAFGSRMGFILTAAGSAVGLGNIWKFPYIAGENGGGMFVLIYLVCIALVGLPIMVAEMMIGRAAQKQPVAAIHQLQGKKSPWAAIGWMGVLAGFIILSFYVVVAGWSMDYTLKSISNFTNPITAKADASADAYRATATIEDMKAALVTQEAASLAHDDVAAERRELGASKSAAYARFQAGMAAARTAAARTSSATARARLLEDQELAAAVAAVEPIMDRIEAIQASKKMEATALWEARSEPEVRAAATQLFREGNAFTPRFPSVESYRATATIEDMRAALIAREASRLGEVEVATERRKLSPGHSKAFDRFLAGMESAKKAIVEVSMATARTRLLENAELAEAVKVAEPIMTRIAEIEAAARIEATKIWNAAGEAEVREAATTLHRRNHIKDGVTGAFLGLAADGLTSTFWASLFMVLTVLIVMGGISGGIERTCRFLMPALILLICLMVFYGMTTEGFGKAVKFVFAPDASKLTGEGVLEALGHAFFTLSLGMGAMITYGSYQKGKANLLGQSLWIAGLDTGIALLACLMMFPVMFTFGMEPGQGAGLAFISMPLAFAQIGTVGMLLSIIFFGLLVFAALTSSVSLLEVVCSYFIDEKGWSRKRAALTMGGAIFLFAIPVAYHADHGGLFSSWDAGYGMSYFDTMDIFASNWLLPIGGFFIAIYAGWVMPAKFRATEMEGIAAPLVLTWLLVIRFVAPALVLLVILSKIGVLKLG